MLLVGMGWLFIGRQLDRSFITFRYALNIATGQGFAYNAGETTLHAAVSPLYAGLLALISLAGSDLPRLSGWFGVAGLALGAASLYAALARPDNGLLPAAAAALYLLFPLLWFTIGLETSLWMGLCLLGLWLHVRRWDAAAGLALGLATLADPATLTLALLVLANGVLEGRPFRAWPLSLYAGLTLAGAIWALATFDNPYPPTEPGPGVVMGLWEAFRVMGSLSLLWGVVAGLTLPGLLAAWKDRPLVLLSIWAVLHITILALLGRPIALWTLAPLLPAIAGLAAAGAAWITTRFADKRTQQIAAGLITLLIAGGALETVFTIGTTRRQGDEAWQTLTPTLASQNDREAGEWIAANTMPDATVGVVGTGVLGYTAQRRLFDYHGSLQPELALARARGDGSWWLHEATPDALVLPAELYTWMDGYEPADDPWFAATYTETARLEGEDEPPLLIFTRMATPTDLQEILVGVQEYPDGLALNGIATDFSLSPLAYSGLGRIRLRWLADIPQAGRQTVTIRIQGRNEGAIAGIATREVDLSTWPIRQFVTTYHPIEIVGSLPPGVYDVSVGIGDGSFGQEWRVLAVAKVPFPDASIMGGVSGANATFGDIRLQGYRINLLDEGLEVLLVWVAERLPPTDYVVSIQVRDQAGVVVAYFEGEPHDGDYPTSVWSSGERVPDTYLVDIAAAPPGVYEVYTGLIGPDGNRVLSPEGESAVFVGRVTVSEGP